jgi:hypothetical protein
MTVMNKGFRLSLVQKDTLFILYALQLRGKADPIPLVDILKIVNKGKEKPVFRQNFSVSCNTLIKNKLIKKFRSASLELAFTLDSEGLRIGKEIYNERTAKNGQA